MADRDTIVHGLLAEFDNPAELLHAAEQIRDEGYRKFDCHSPFVIHGMDKAMGLKRSPLGWIVGLFATIGAGGGLLLQWWTSAVDYPIVISGKPLFSFQAFVPITFGLGVLLSAVAALAGMIFLNGLPKFWHPVFFSRNFSRFSTDGFFVSVESGDPKFDIESTRQFLERIGGRNVEVLEEA